MLSRM